MAPETIRHWLDQHAEMERQLRGWGLADAATAAEQLRLLADQVPLDLVASLAEQAGQLLPALREPDQAFAGLIRFLNAARSPLSMLSLFDRDRGCLPILFQVCGTSEAWTDLLVRDPEAFDFLRLTEGMPSSRDALEGEVDRETTHIADERILMAALKRVKEREQLRIGYGELFRNVRVEIAMQQLSDLAEAIVAAALRFAMQRTGEGKLPRLAVIALGRLGGRELDYRSGLELLFVCENLGAQDQRRGSPFEAIEKVARQIVRILSEPFDGEPLYCISFPIRPVSGKDHLVTQLDEFLYYCDAKGRTWERSILLTARPLAGDLELGQECLTQLQPWLYRRYLHRADETGLHALKRRIQRDSAAANQTDLLLGRGGVREIEEAVRFLQLLSGGELEVVRVPGTLPGIAGLEQGNVLTVEERSILEQGYEKLRQWEHSGQLLSSPPPPAAELSERQSRQAETVERLFASAFKDEGGLDPVSELILEPTPTADQIAAALRPYGFQDIHTAAAELQTLAVERIPFLSTRRSRHFLAEIAPALLRSLAATPDPDGTLAKLARVSDSLGGKGVLWELFQKHPPSLELYVRLCGASLYLSELLTSHPGMIDDLLDSLLLSHLPSVEELEAMAHDLLLGTQAGSLQPALAAFRQAQHLRIGVREMLRLEDVASTHRALAAVAEVCVRQIAQDEFDRLAQKHGPPGIPSGDRCEFVILALGKFGGREPNYHSPLELAFIYEAEGATQPPLRSRSSTSTTNAHFFSLLAQRIIKTLTELGPQGRLYEVHTPLRPQGRTGPVAISRDELRRYLTEGSLSPSELHPLVKARPIYGVPTAGAAVENIVVESLLAREWRPEFGEQIRHSRQAEEKQATGRNLKRAAGGTTDVETVIQILQWQHAGTPGLVGVGTLAAIDRLRERGWLSAAEAEHWSRSYRFLRGVESAVRLMNAPARHDLPATSVDWRRLAMVLQYPEPQQLAEHVRSAMAENRERFERFFAG